MKSLHDLIQKELQTMRRLREDFRAKHRLAKDPDTDEYLILQALLEYNRGFNLPIPLPDREIVYCGGLSQAINDARQGKGEITDTSGEFEQHFF